MVAPRQRSFDDAHTAALKAEIASRYRARARAKGYFKRPRTIAAIRIAELTRLFDYRWGNVLLPSSEDGAIAARVMVHHIAALPDASRRITQWLATCTPWMRLADRERLFAEAMECPLKWRADKLGWKLRLSDLERSKLKISTIGAFDLPKAARDARRKAMKRAKLERRRRAAGAKPRAQYLLEQAAIAKPWIAEGMSRATWFRRRKLEP